MKYLIVNVVFSIVIAVLLAHCRVANAFSTTTTMSAPTPTIPTLNVQTVRYYDDDDDDVGNNMKKCYEVRQSVFIEEQQVPIDIEIDADDKIATHILATMLLEEGDGGSSAATVVVGTARIVYYNTKEEGGKDRVGKIGRVCVMKEHRGNGYGRAIVLFALEEIRKAFSVGSTTNTDDCGGGGGGGMAKLGAQVHTLKFYESMGFEIIPNTSEYIEAGIPHRDMQQQVIG